MLGKRGGRKFHSPHSHVPRSFPDPQNRQAFLQCCIWTSEPGCRKLPRVVNIGNGHSLTPPEQQNSTGGEAFLTKHAVFLIATPL